MKKNQKNNIIVLVLLICVECMNVTLMFYEYPIYVVNKLKKIICPICDSMSFQKNFEDEIFPSINTKKDEIGLINNKISIKSKIGTISDADELILECEDTKDDSSKTNYNETNNSISFPDDNSVYNNEENLKTDTYEDSITNDNNSNDNTNIDYKDNTGNDSINTFSFNNNGINYTREELADYDFLVANCYSIDSTTSVTKEELDTNVLLNKDLTVDISKDEYKVLIYHTHGSETFSDSRPGVSEDTVIGVGDELTRILEEDYGIKTYHDRTVYDMVDGKLDRSLAYDFASEGIDEILLENPSIEVVLDIHRDGVRDDVYLTRVIDGRKTAQIMFLNGVSRTNSNGDIDYLYNPNKIDNLSFSLQMHLKGKEMYGDLMRRIYIRGYCFNLDKMPRAALIEVGAQTNTVEEAKNAMIPLGAIIYRELTEK